MSVRVDHRITSGTFHLDGGSWEVDNNVWVIGDDQECLLIDAPHDPDAVLAVVDGRRLTAIACTHGHDDHINVAAAVAEVTGAPVLIHLADRVLWDMTYPDREPDGYLTDDMTLHVAGTPVQVLHTPGHAPGAVCLYAPELGAVFSGDTLFSGGPGATGRSYSDFGTIIHSIRTKLFALPPDTVVHTGHGEDTTIAAELPHLDEWIERGD